MPSDGLQRAARLYRSFREQPVRRVREVSIQLPAAVARMGLLEFVGYMTTHAGTPALYVHYFAPGSRPVLYASGGRNQLMLYGGRFKVTGRGITDLDSRGKVIDYTPRYVTVERGEWERMKKLANRRQNLTNRRRAK